MKHTVLEAWLDRSGVKYEYLPEVALAEIPEDVKAEDNIRLGSPLLDDVVQKYALDLENGADFPALVLYRMTRGKLTGKFGKINGRHRLAAYKICDRVKTDAYVVKTDDEVVIEVLQRTVNMIEGLPLSEEERILHAVRLVDLDYSMADAARMLSVKLGQIRDRKQYDEALKKLRAAGVEMGNLRLTQSAIVKLRAIPRDKHFVRAIRLAHEARLTSNDMQELISAVRAAPDDASAEEVLGTWERDNQDRLERTQKGTKRGPTSPIRSLPGVLQRAERILKNPGNLRAMTLQEIDMQRRHISAAIKSLSSVLKQLEAARRKLVA